MEQEDQAGTARKKHLDTTLALDYQDPRLSDGVSNVFGPLPREIGAPAFRVWTLYLL